MFLLLLSELSKHTGIRPDTDPILRKCIAHSFKLLGSACRIRPAACAGQSKVHILGSI